MHEDTLITCGLLTIGTLLLGPIVLSIIALVRTRRILVELESLRQRNQKLTHQMAELRNSMTSGAVAPPSEPRVAPPPVPRPPVAVVPTIAKQEYDAPVVHPSPTPVPSLARLVEEKLKAAASADVVAPSTPAAPKTPRDPAPPPMPLEAYVGQKVLPWLGVAVLVLGIAFFLWYAYSNMGPKGRLALAAATGTVMVTGGAFAARKEKYALLGGCIIAGGWAVLYGTAFAVHYIPASQIVESPTAGFLVLLFTGAAAVLHALRQDREGVVALAYGLIFATFFLAPEQGLAAWLGMGISGASLVVLAWRRRWIRLCTFGAAVIYGAEIFWLKDARPDQVLPMATLLIGLWLIFQLPDLFHRPADEVGRAFHSSLVMINFVGVLVAGYLLHVWLQIPVTGTIRLLLGAIYAAKAVIGRRHIWTFAWGADLVFALVMLGAGVHERFDGLWPSMGWLGLTALLFGYGVAVRASYPRIVAALALVITLLRTWTYDRGDNGVFSFGRWDVDRIILPALLGAALCYAFAAVAAKLREKDATPDAEGAILLPLLHVGGLALALALWYFPPEISVAVLFAMTSLALIELGRWRYVPALVHQGLHFAVISIFFVSIYNLEAEGLVTGISRRVASTLPVLAVWAYLRETAKVGHGTVDFSDKARRFFATITFAGLLALLRFELGASGTPLAWTLASFAWLAWGLAARRSVEYSLGSIGAALSTLMLAATRNPSVPLTTISGPTSTGVPMIFFFLVMHLASRLKVGTPGRVERLMRDLLAISMASSAFILLAQGCTGTWLTGSWAILGFALTGYGFALRDRVSRWSGLIVLAICLGKVGLFDLASFEMPVRIATLMVLGLVMIALSFVYVRFNRVVKDFLTAE